MMLLRRLYPVWHDRRAAVAPMVAAFGAALVGAMGFALDAGLYYAGSRDLRAATESAALAAAMYPAQAEARARDSLSRNGFDPAILRSVVLGRYCADAAVPASQRFDASFTRCPGNGQSTAVRIQTGKPSRQFFTRVLGGANPIPALSATATAARVDEAGVGVSSGILTVTNALVNSVNDLLGALLGIKLQLGANEVQTLANGYVDAGRFFDALAARVGETGTYGALTNRTVDLRALMLAAAEAADQPATAATLTLVAGRITNGYPVPLNGLFGLGVWKNMPVGEANEQPGLRAGINAYQLFTFAVQAGEGSIDLTDAISRVASGSTIRLAAVATGPIDRPRFAFGPAGETSASTSALRLQLNLGLNLDILGISVGAVPVLIDVAAARADVSAIDCANTAEQARDSRVSVLASSGLINAYIGQAPANAMTRPMPPLSASDIAPARILNVLNLITADVRAVAQPVTGNSGTLVFGPGGQGTIGRPGTPGTPASIGNGSQTGTLLTSLTNSLSAPNGLQVKALNLCIWPLCDETATRSHLLGAITTPLGALLGNPADPLLDNLLTALGIQLGHATVWVTGARCGVPVLI